MGTTGDGRGVAAERHDLKLDEGMKSAKGLSAVCGGAEDLEAGESTLEDHIKVKLRRPSRSRNFENLWKMSLLSQFSKGQGQPSH